METPKMRGVLLRFPAGAAVGLAGAASRRLSVGGVSLELEPLFPAEGGGLAMAATRPAWFVARVPAGAGLAAPNAWAIAHEAVRSGAALAGGGPDLVEPDLEQEWPYDSPSSREAGLGAAGACGFHDQVGRLPHEDRRFAWQLDDDFSQLHSARGGIPPGSASAVRIAHLDTGYDPGHATFPANVRRDIQRNFIDDQPAGDAHDPARRGLGKNPGHGTGTLSILAGGRFRFSGAGYAFDDAVGGAPDAEIVPVRIGDSVVRLYTSSVAKGINYAAGLCGDEQTRVHVISMSMGGLASAAWADAVNAAYEAGIVFVAAAGNNISAGFFAFPAKSVVYPARFERVIAACGVMADRRPYYGLPLGVMQGNWGPSSKMATALAAYTPNTSWAALGCPDIVDMDGAGTSAATPQVAAAAALYLRRHGQRLFDSKAYPEPWMRVEAVRQALFLAADKSADGGSADRLGNGIVQAARALAFEPPDASSLQKTRPAAASFGFLRVLTGLGATGSAADAMLQLEATQLAQRWGDRDQANKLEAAVRDPDQRAEAVPAAEVRRYLEALHDHPEASPPLKKRVEEVLGARFARRPAPSPPDGAPPGGAGGKRATERRSPEETPAAPAEAAPAPPTRRRRINPTVRPPQFRCLRGFAVDPSLATDLDAAPISQVVFQVPWEKLEPGPVGEYLEVIDADPASGPDCFYAPVDLDDPLLLGQNGLAPSEGTPQFHQQMVYAVASLTIRNFERALGRRTLWSPGPSPDPKNPANDSRFVRRLRVYPHALREANAYYSPERMALLFGYFSASEDEPGDHLPGGRVFTCLSHDIVAHETTHALLDGMHRRFLLASNPDVRAFHEGFADLVALFQHFTFPEILRHQIATTRGEIRSQRNLLGEMAGQFGRATGLRGALRSAIGRVERRGDRWVWEPRAPDPKDYRDTPEPHLRGAILVAAVFDAFLSIYEHRVQDLVRLATGGSGVLRPGAIHPDLVARLAEEARKAAQHVLTMCIRALDYCPPTDITFGEYLRAIVTADFDLVPDDDLHYRVAFIEAFRRRGIYPADVKTMSVESLLWRGPHEEEQPLSRKLEDGLGNLRGFAEENLYGQTREQAFFLQRKMRLSLHDWLRRHFDEEGPRGSDAAFLGLDPGKPFEVHTARFAYRVSPDGDIRPQILVGLLQQTQVPVDPQNAATGTMPFEGGCTVVADLHARKVLRCIRKSVGSRARLENQRSLAAFELESPRYTYSADRPFGPGAEPFAALHRGF